VSEQAADHRTLVKVARPITLRDLLTHTSGLGEYLVNGPHWSLAEFVRTLAREPLRFQPGTRWAYSTAGIDTLGRIVEVVSEKPFAEFMQKRLFEPLGMKDTTFWPTPEQEKRFAHNYRPNAQTGKLEETVITFMYDGAIGDHARPALGGAGLFSTAADVARVYQMMLRGGEFGGHQLLKPATVAEMTRKQTGDLRARPGMPWGLGFCVIEDPTQMEANKTYSPGSFGHGGAHGTSSWDDPATGLVHVFMIQRAALRPNPDDSAMRRAYEAAIAAALR
jgi:CubicO group peptidase (beta-lactamase class C family)